MRRILGALLLLLCPFGVGSAQSLSENELTTLTVEQLARRALGEAGKLMLGVDRSNLPYSISFFTKASAPSTQSGLCMSDWVTLELDQEHIWSISAQAKFGVVGSIYAPLSENSQQHNERQCSAVYDTTDYFPAPTWIDAQRIVAYLDYLQRKTPFTDAEYAFECTGSCDRIDAGEYLKSIALKDIVSVSTIDCTGGVRDGDCYKLTLRGNPPGLFPRELRLYGRNSRSAAELSSVSLWIGQTFF